MYEEILQRERDLQGKLKDFVENSIDQWKRAFEKADYLHLNEPLLRKEGKYYIVNIQPEVRKIKKSIFSSRFFFDH